ncbi:MAG: signal peptidase II [Lachnospiraceae bacterium]|nr:signal peptidase II [Lachnospiraceae bacterium]
MKNLSRNVGAIVLLVLLVLSDQASKAYIRANYSIKESKPLINKVLYILYIENDGMAFSLLKGKQIFLIIITVVLMSLALYYYLVVLKDNKYTPLRLIIIFITAGGLGNLIDRLRFGKVTDFIYFSPINFPVFNVADIYVTCSIFVLLILLFTKYRHDELLKE